MKNKVSIFGFNFSTLSLDRTAEWVTKNTGILLCCGLNDLMLASDDSGVRKTIMMADKLTMDGMPIVWLARRRCGKGERVYGPDLMKKVLFSKLIKRNRHLFLGNKENQKYFETIGKYVALPYKDRFDDGDYEIMAKSIKESGAKIIWVGLGAKKQILVASELKKRLSDRLYITVGAAFDFLSGNKKQAPLWLRKMGGEWLFRLLSEPKRLSERYSKILFFLFKLIYSRLIYDSNIPGGSKFDG